jgi:hypothetical protein
VDENHDCVIVEDHDQAYEPSAKRRRNIIIITDADIEEDPIQAFEYVRTCVMDGSDWSNVFL